MKPKTITILIIVFFALFAFVLLYRNILSKPSEKNLFRKSDIQKLSKLEIIRNNNNKYVFEKQPGLWQATQPLAFKLDKELINEFIASIQKISLKNLISTSSDKYARFGVSDASSTIINIYGSAKKPPISLFPGKQADYNPSNIYIRLKGKPEVYISEGPYEYMLVRDIKDWLDKTILAIDKNQVTEIILISSKETSRLYKKGEKWLVINTEKGEGEEAEPAECSALLGNLEKLTACEIIFSTENPKALQDKTGFDKPVFQLLAKLQNGEEKKVLVGNKYQNSNYYVKLYGEATLYGAYAYTIDNLKKTAAQLKRKTPPAPEPPKAEQLQGK